METPKSIVADRQTIRGASLLFLILAGLYLGFWGMVPWAMAQDQQEEWVDDDPFAKEEAPQVEVADPLEPMNRVFFTFNDKLYYWLLKPVSRAYSAVLPLDLRQSFDHFFRNLYEPVNLVNAVLQGRVGDAGVVASRILINSTLGVFGFGDPAKRNFGLDSRKGDFGQTLGVWGLGDGLYLCLPVVGPSNLRDSIGFVGDSYSHPVGYVNNGDLTANGLYYGNKEINSLSLDPSVYEDLKKFSLDPYVSMRQAYTEYRHALIEDGGKGKRSGKETSWEMGTLLNLKP